MDDAILEPTVGKQDLIIQDIMLMSGHESRYPDRIRAHIFGINDVSRTYAPLIFCDAIVELNNQDNAIGKCTCSSCGKSMDIFNKYCPNCGAKKRRVKLAGESNEEN